MRNLLLVALGGALGSSARYLISVAAMAAAGGPKFPLGTFAVNVFGCLTGGVLAGLAAKTQMFDPSTRLFLFTGVLGGFTTFSAFGLDAIDLLRRGELAIAASYVVGSVAFGLIAVWIGFSVAVRG